MTESSLESPGGATVRSVRVRLEAEIASYVAEMRTAGRETDAAFERVDKRLTSVNRALSRTERGLQGVSRAEQSVASSTTSMNTELDKTDRVLVRNERSLGRNTKQLDTFSGRAALALQLLAGFGPALVPLGGIALAAIGGVSAQLGFATAAGGSAILAFQGVGDALDAIEKARLEPTVDNLQAARDAVADLAPAAQVLVRHLGELRDEGRELQFAAAGGFLPGVDDALANLESRIPDAKRILTEISDAAGDALAEGGESLASDRWNRFFEYLENEGRPQLDGIADSVGNVTHGVAELFATTAGLQRDFTGWLRESTEDFDTWATRVGNSTEYAEFLDYVRTNGPQVAETTGAIASAFIEITEAAAPLGGPALQVLETIADVVSAIADSDLGTPIFTGLAALSLYTRATKLLGSTAAVTYREMATGQKQIDLGYQRGRAAVATMGRDLSNVVRYGSLATESSKRLGSQLATAGRAAGPIAGLALASSGAADKIGLTNTASLALMGTLAGPWGAALGAGVGLTLDLAAANNSLEDAIAGVNAAMESGDLDAMLERRAQLAAEIENQDFTIGRNTGFGDIGGMLNALTGATDRARGSLDEVDDAIHAAARAGSQYIDAAHGIAEAEREQAAATMQATAAMEAKRAESLRGLNAELDYQQAIDDARKALKENGQTIDETTDKGRNNLRALYELAAAWNNQSDAAKNAKGSLKEAQTNFILTADSMGMPIQQAERLADRLFEIPPKRKVDILVETGSSLDLLDRLKARMDAIRSKDVYVNVHTGGGSRPMGGPIVDAGADGMTVQGRRTPYRDRVLTYLAPGEEVISNRHGQADRHRPLLKRINANRLADGGTAGTYTSRKSSSAWAGTQWADGMGQAAHRVVGSLKQLEARLDKISKAYDKEKSKLDSLTEARRSTADSIASSLLHNPFGNGLAGFDAQLDADSGDITALGQALATLVRNGLDPKSALYQRLAAEADVTTAQQLAALSKSDLASRAHRFEAVTSQAQRLGNTVAGQRYDEAIRASTKATDKLERRMESLEDAIRDFKKVPGEVRDAVHDGAWAGSEAGTAQGWAKARNAQTRDLASSVRNEPRPMAGRGRR